MHFSVCTTSNSDVVNSPAEYGSIYAYWSWWGVVFVVVAVFVFGAEAWKRTKRVDSFRIYFRRTEMSHDLLPRLKERLHD